MTAHSRRVRILLVEDDNHIGRIIEMALPELGIPYEFVTVLGAEEGLELWDQQPFDLVMADYNLRGMTGLELIEALQARGATVPTVMVTAYDTDSLRRQARALGVNAYLAKPFFIDQLINTLRELVNQSQARAVG